MHETIKKMAQTFVKQREQRRRAYAGFTALALVVSISTTYMLVQPASTMAVDYVCGMEEHVHTEECFETVLICTDENREGHTHSEECYPMTYICGQEEVEAHAHGDACYGLICGEEETEGHTHSDACYAQQSILSCSAKEGEGHTHSDSCYGNVCGKAEGEGHTHSDACYTEQSSLICEQEESDGHSHDDGCYDEAGELACGESESDGHSHGDSCYTTESKLTCGEDESEAHTHDDSCSGLTCGEAEYEAHTHDESCYTFEDELVCGEDECEPHTHDDSCTGLICELAETEGHAHTAECEGGRSETPACGLEECEPYVTDHVHGEECYESVLVCELEEHEHDETCYLQEELMMVLPEGAEIPEGYDVEYSVTDEDNRFAVAVYTPVGALPEGAELKADLLEEDSDEYAAAEEALDAEYDGMVALDIRFELDGKEVEPTEKVYVYMNVIGLLPETVDPESVAVHHIKETEEKILNIITVDTEVTVDVVADTTEDTEGIVEMAESEEAAALDMTAAFPVDSFSVFAAVYKSPVDKADPDRYYLGLRQVWTGKAADNPYILAVGNCPGNWSGHVHTDECDLKKLVSCLDYAKYADTYDYESIVKVDQPIPKEYGANGLVLGYKEYDEITPFFPKGLTSDYNWKTSGFNDYYHYDTAGNQTGNSESALDSGAICAAPGISLVASVDKNVIKKGMTDIDTGMDTEAAKFVQKYPELKKIVDNDAALEEYNAKLKSAICGNFGALYTNVGTYNGEEIDLKITVVDYAPSNTGANGLTENSVIGVRVVGDKSEKKPGVCSVDVAWVELEYQFLISGTNTPIAVKGNTSYYDVDGNQGVFLDDECTGIYVTNQEAKYDFASDTKKNGNHSDKTNICRLHLGWFNEEGEGYYRPGWGVYQGDYEGINEETAYTAHAFTETFDTGTEGKMNRVFTFEDVDDSGDGTIYHSGFPVIREGNLTVKKWVEKDSDGERNTNQTFNFEVSLSGTYDTNKDASAISGTYGDMTFADGKAVITVKHGEAAVANGLPAGINYTVKETNYDGYTVSVNGRVTDETSGTIPSSVELKVGEEPIVEFVNTPNDVILDKTVGNEDDGLWINLEAYVTGETTTTTSQKPTDIILVLDQSSSMLVPMGHDDYHMSNNWDGTETVKTNVFTPSGPVTAYSYQEIIDNPELQDKALKSGYFITQSTVTGNWYVVENNNDGTWSYHIVTDCGLPEKYAYRYWHRNADGTVVLGNLCEKALFATPDNPTGETSQDHMTYTKELSNVPDVLKGTYYVTQYGALYDALIDFIEGVQASGVDHRLALVGFAGTELSHDTNTVEGDDVTYVKEVDGVKVSQRTMGSGLYIGSVCRLYSTPTVVGGGLTTADYQEAFMSFKSDYTDIKAAVNAYNTNSGGTNWAVGLAMANNILTENQLQEGEDRDRVVIFFTDGEPSGTLEPNDTTSGYASAINYAKMVKEKATVYTMATSTTDGYEDLVYMSSNHPDAAYSYSAPVGVSYDENLATTGYSKKIGDAGELKGIFSTISSTVTNPTTSLGPDAELSDTLSKDFKLDTSRDIQVYAPKMTGGTSADDFEFETLENAELWKSVKVGADYTVTDSDAEIAVGADKITVTVMDGEEGANETIVVKGFDYSNHFVYADREGEGRKIVVRVPIVPADSNKGGIEQATNDSADLEDEPFPDPYVDTPTTVKIKKIVSGTTTDQAFEFKADYDAFDSYESLDLDDGKAPDVTGGSNYLRAIWKEVTDAVPGVIDGTKDYEGLKNGDVWTISQVKPYTDTDRSYVTVYEKAEDGYHMTATYTYDGNDSGEITVTNITLENGYYKFSVESHPGLEITVTNSTGPVLPSTGGSGTQMYTAAGLALMMGAGFLFLEEQRRKVKEAVCK